MSTAQISSSCVSPEFPITETCDRYQSGLTEEKSTPKQSILLRDHLPVNRFQCKESDREQPTDGTALGQSYKPSFCSNLNSFASRTYQGYLTALLNPDTAEVHISKFLEMQFPKSGTDLNGAVSARDTLELPSLEKDYFWLDRPTALSTTANSRPPGLCKAERQWRKLGLIGKQEVASPDFLEKLFDIPSGWTSPQESKTAIQLLEDAEKQLETPWIGESLRSPSEESYTSTPSVPKTKESQDNYSTSKSTTLKAISLWQPWASLIPLGLKHYETRSWKTNYRGKLLICSTVKNSKHYQQYLKIKDELQLPAWNEENFPHGCAIAVCDLVDCTKMTPEFIAQQSQTEILCGDWQVGQYAWKLENIQPITEPFAVKGKQGLFNISLKNLECYLKKKEFNSNQSSKKGKKKSSDCWYTPPHIVELVVQVLGLIDLDPCADDGKHIPAQFHYTAIDDGLEREWKERIFMNPPYSCPGKWMSKLQAEVEAGRVKEAIALVPAATDTNWLSPVLKTQPVCFWKGRIKFLGEDYQPKSSARQSHVLVYWGNSPQKFQEVFEAYGYVPPLPHNDPLLGDNKNSPSNSPSKVNFSPSKRQRGFGNGYIYWRTITKKGKDYPQAYYHWKDNGKKRTKYIPKRLLGVIQEAEKQKRPVIEILELLGVGVSPSDLLGDAENSPSNNQAYVDIEDSSDKLLGDKQANDAESIENTIFEDSPSNSPSKVDFSPSKRRKGDGSGSIHWRTITKGGKDYPQAYYHYELWKDGDRLIKSSKYISKRLLSQVQQLESEKAPVRKILGVLGVKL